MSAYRDTPVRPSSQLVFHSLVGQLCLTSTLPPKRLLHEVKTEFSQLHAGVSPAEVASRLFSRVSNASDPEWIPRISHELWDVPGIRVSVHSDTHYLVTSIKWDGQAEHESWNLSVEKTKGWMRRKHALRYTSSDIQVVLQSMVGNIVVILDWRKDAARDALLSAVADPTLRRSSTSISGAILAKMWRDATLLQSMSIDVGYPEGTPDTLWLRHLSGETYALSEGIDPHPSEWQIVGKSFLGPSLERHLRISAVRA
jgi:hypothetical protein